MCSIELGKIEMVIEVIFWSQHLCSHREGHLNSTYEIFRYLLKNLSKNPVRTAFDPDFVQTNDKVFEGIAIELEDWKYF